MKSDASFRRVSSEESCRRICWVDGRIQSLDEPVWRPDDSAVIEGRACYTTVRIRDGRPRFPERHWRRLARGALAIGLPEVDERRVRQAHDALAREAFPGGEGAVRLQASCDGRGTLNLIGIPRGLGDEPPEWTAVTVASQVTSPVSGGHKLSGRLGLTFALERARDAGVQEALLIDASGQLVEGARSNIFVVDASGRLVTPPLPRGAVAGVARQLVMERIPDAAERDIALSTLRSAPEIIAVNALRGAAPILALDGRAVGRGVPGPRAEQLGSALDRD